MREDEIKKTILKIVGRHLDTDKTKVFLFGSRAAGYAGKWSDYDLGLEAAEAIPPRTMALIQEDLEASDLPVRVEVVDFQRVNPRFRKQALRKIQLWQTS
jgi:predicted nucleotidyltransferase